MIKALNILKLVNHRLQDLHSIRGFDSFRGKDDSKASIQSLGGSGVQLFFCPLEEIFTICNVSNLTKPQNLEQRGFPLSDDRQVFYGVGKISPPYLRYFGDNIFRTPVG